MSEARFDRIDHKFIEIDQKFVAVDHRFDGIEQRLDRLDLRLDGLKAGMDGRFEELDRQMRVLHEDVKADIAAIPEYKGPTKAEMDRGFAELRESIGRRLDPLEAAVRRNSLDIEELKKSRG